MTPVGFARRLGVMLYDALLLAAVLMAATALLLPFSGGDAIHPWLMRPWVLAVSFAFLGGFWTRGGQTLGMKAWRVRVVRADGGALRWSDAAKRFLYALPSVGLFGAGVLWQLVDRERLALHDRWSRTRLVVADRS